MPTGTKNDSGKPRWSLIPNGVVAEVVQVLEFGAARYGEDNWQKVPDARRRYYDAAHRHMDQYWSGEQTDPDTGLHHLSHAICSLMFIVWMDKNGDVTKPAGHTWADNVHRDWDQHRYNSPMGTK